MAERERSPGGADRDPGSRPGNPSESNPPPQSHGRDQLPPFLVVGQVIRPHGVRGDLLVESSSETFRSIRPGGELYFGADSLPHAVTSLRAHQGRHLLRLQGCDDRAAAERFRGMQIRIALEQAEPLPEGVYYRWQILGLRVVDQAGQLLGSIADIIETGANDVYVIERDDRPELLLPAIDTVILQVDLSAEQVIVAVPEGLD